MKRARENHNYNNNGNHSQSPRDRAKVARDSKCRWASEQAWIQLSDDHKRAYASAKQFRNYMGYENANPSFDEVTKIIELFYKSREHVWNKCDLEAYMPEVPQEDVKTDTSNARYERCQRSYDDQDELE